MEITLSEAFTGVTKEKSLRKKNQCETCDGSGGDPEAGTEKCGNCGGRGRVRKEKRTIFGNIAQEVTCPECKGSGEIPKKDCSDCSGKGFKESIKKVKIDIPAGIKTGQTLKVSGQGQAAGAGTVPGDLLVNIRVKKHDKFKRDGDNLYYSAQIDYSLAALGGKAKIPTFDENGEIKEVKLKVPKGSNSGKRIKLSGKGMPRLNGYKRGDMYVDLKVNVPEKVTKKQKELLQKLKEEGL